MNNSFLVDFGRIFNKIGAAVVAVPAAVLGGMTVFLFPIVFGSGLRILAGLQWTRRDRFILACAFAVGMGVVVVPHAFTSFIPEESGEVLSGLRQGIFIILTTGYSIGSLIAIIINFALPQSEDASSSDELQKMKRGTKSSSPSSSSAIGDDDV